MPRISQLPAISAATYDALLPIVQSGITDKITLANLYASMNVQINVKTMFGATGLGSADDTSAINNAIAYGATLARKSIYFPYGNYKTTASLTPMTGSRWTICGDGRGATRIFTTANAPVFTFDVRAATLNFNTVRDMSIEGEIPGTYSSSVGILIDADPASATGLQRSGFFNVQFSNLYRGIYMEQTGLLPFGGFDQLSANALLTFQNIYNVIHTTSQTFECIATEGAGPQISEYLGGFISGCSNAGIRLGTGATNDAIGDQLFSGIHILGNPVCIDLFGPTGSGRYNQNINIVGCQLDGASTATVRMDHMQNFRIGPNNSTATVGPVLTNCSNYFLEDRNTFSFPSGKVTSFGDKIYPGTDAGAVQSGSGIYAGTGVPNDANGANGDFYFRGDGTGGANTAVYHKEGGIWVALVTS